MPYSVFLAPVLPYHLDNTVVKWISASLGVLNTISVANMLEINDEDYTIVSVTSSDDARLTFFFPELTDVIQMFALADASVTHTQQRPIKFEWSEDTTNGIDGVWADATMVGGFNTDAMLLDSWRTNATEATDIIGAIAVRITFSDPALGADHLNGIRIAHLYGHKHAGETPDDILFLNPDDGDAEYDVPIDFGDVPTASSKQMKFKLHNDSAGLDANNVVITVIDPDDQIRIGVTNVGPWLTTDTVVLLLSGADTAVYYVKCEAPAAPAFLGPNRAPISVVVGAWT